MHDRKIWAAKRRVNAAVPALVEAVKRSCRFAELLRRNGQLGFADDLEWLIRDALAPLGKDTTDE